MEQQAAEAERASVRYKMAEYLEGQVGQVFDGIISGLTDWGIYVELTDNKCEGMVRLQSLRNDRYSFSEKDYAIIGARTKQRYAYGQPVKVRVKGADKEKRQIDFYLIES
jgi:ribonuclease R